LPRGAHPAEGVRVGQQPARGRRAVTGASGVEPAAAALPIPCLMLVTDRRLARGGDLVGVVDAAVDGGVNAVQLREKDLSAMELWRLAVRLRDAIGDRALFLVNDRLDVAMAVAADGVHLPGDGLPARAVRAVAGAGRLVGCSVHDVAQARACAAD